MVKVQRLVVGPLMTNCYIVSDEDARKCAVIDPGGEGAKILETVQENGFTIEYIICTHGHLDHIYEAGFIQRRSGAPVVIGEKDRPLLEDPGWMAALMDTSGMVKVDECLVVKEGDAIDIGSMRLEVLETPGHTPGSISLYYPGGSAAEGSGARSLRALFSGDLIFRLSVGRTDFPGGDMDILLRSIRSKVLSLPDETVIYPGHNQTTTVGKERTENPFLA
ncbi:MAG: MBL fold metallo-hydrolase [Firmicutes bacterium]|nr:MBL fold metallo-hydrolase [Candidatus Fermentithermobacillaceae bacterium]